MELIINCKFAIILTKFITNYFTIPSHPITSHPMENSNLLSESTKSNECVSNECVSSCSITKKSDKLSDSNLLSESNECESSCSDNKLTIYEDPGYTRKKSMNTVSTGGILTEYTEDRYFTTEININGQPLILMIVLDGHNGLNVVEFVLALIKEHTIIFANQSTDARSFFENLVRFIHEETTKNLITSRLFDCGCTFCGCTYNKNTRELTTCNLGDSSCKVYRPVGTGIGIGTEFEQIFETIGHCADNQEERERIIALDPTARFTKKKYPVDASYLINKNGLQIMTTRGFGDWYFNDLIERIPDIQSIILNPSDIIIVASDGLEERTTYVGIRPGRDQNEILENLKKYFLSSTDTFDGSIGGSVDLAKFLFDEHVDTMTNDYMLVYIKQNINYPNIEKIVKLKKSEHKENLLNNKDNCVIITLIVE